MAERFRCPACGFRVYNRRVRYCEKCKAALPPEFQYTEAELAKIEEERRKNEESVQRSRERRDVSVDFGSGWLGDGGAVGFGGDGGDGGGGCD